MIDSRKQRNRPAADNGEAASKLVDRTNLSVQQADRHAAAPTEARVTNSYPSRSTPVVAAQLLPATGRRHLDIAVVHRCPHCRRTHLHRGGDLDGAPKVSGCNPARPYILAVVA